MERLSAIIVSRMIVADVISKSDEAEYMYNVQVLLERALSYTIILGVSIIARCTIPTILFCLSFAAVRTFSGGYHCDSYIKCLALSTIIALSTGFIFPLINMVRSLYQGVVIMSVIIIISLGSINNQNIDWSGQEYRRAKVLARLSVVTIFVLLLLLEVISVPDNLSFYISYGIVVCAISMLFEIRKRGGIAYEGHREESFEDC